MTKKKEVVLRSQSLNYDTNAAGDESGLDCRYDLDTGEETPSLTQQHFAEECDINTIVKRFGLTKDAELLKGARMPVYGDFSGVHDYQTALNAVRQAAEDFMDLPAEVRARFGHDPQRLLEFVGDDRNHDEARKMGLTVSTVAQAGSLTPPPVGEQGKAAKAAPGASDRAEGPAPEQPPKGG